ncbi:outer membrane beta-barrel protein [Compostibacter hankyongensis]|uniref:Outer membrane protein beta-barrel domain-containing protein n=1 Tax=Compostibacter hankyongensis TaxID=1007089 RepID=A0ABP8G5A4_9BACT
MQHRILTGAALLGLALWTVSAKAQDSSAHVFSENANADTTGRADTTGKVRSDTSNFGMFTVIRTKKDSSGTSKPSTRVELGTPRGKTAKTAGNVSLHWLDLDLGFTNYIDNSAYGTAEVNDFAPVKPGEEAVSAQQFSLRPGKSVNVNIWLLSMRANLIRHRLNLKADLGIEMNNYRYRKNITYVSDFSKTYVIRDSVDFSKNKLFTEYLTLPVMLNLETNPFHVSNSFRISAGPTFGYLVKSRTKQISEERGKKKNKDSFNLEKFRVGLRGELGYSWITLYGSYSLTPIHQYGLDQHPFSIGIILLNNPAW